MVFEGISYFSVCALVTATCLWVLARMVLPDRSDRREPPVVPSPVPFIGHVFGILRYGASYFRYLG